MDASWAHLVAHPTLAAEIPVEYCSTDLLSGTAAWTTSTKLNTTSLSRIFFEQLGVTTVNSSFVYYRDAFLFGMMLTWGLEIQSFDLSREQSAASFALLQRLSSTKPPPRPEPMARVIGPQDGTDFAEHPPWKPRYDKFMAKNSKRLRKRTGATRWTQKICKALERYLRGMQEVPDDGYGPAHPALEMQVQLGSGLAEDIWAVVLDCDDPGRRALSLPTKRGEKRKRSARTRWRARARAKASGGPELTTRIPQQTDRLLSRPLPATLGLHRRRRQSVPQPLRLRQQTGPQ